jgi:hypothetical protein
MVSRSEVINSFISHYENPTYLEIGVSEGETFFSINTRRKVAVDPHFIFDIEKVKLENTHFLLHEVTSDRFFENIDPSDRFNVIYLDGLHTFEQTLRDFTNSINFLAHDGVIIIDDVVPSSYAASLPSQADAFLMKRAINEADNSWMGDTFKVVFFIRAFFPTFALKTINNNHGQAIVWRARRASPAIADFTPGKIDRLEFVDITKHGSIFDFASHGQILQEFTNQKALIGRKSTI